MEIISLLLPMALAIALIFIISFVWAAKNGQYDDLDTPASRMLLDDQIETTKNNNQTNFEKKGSTNE
jgi:cbb3-type cytochrome oxidase maturation protein